MDNFKRGDRVIFVRDWYGIDNRRLALQGDLGVVLYGPLHGITVSVKLDRKHYPIHAVYSDALRLKKE